nr:hypothetical protein [Tanacetum cinerariifolium]
VDENIIDEHYHKFIQVWFAHTVYEVHEYSRAKYLVEQNLGLPTLEVSLIVPAFLKKLIYKVHGLLVLLLELIRFGNLLSVLGVGQGTVFSIPIVFSWGGSIGPEGFRPSILLLTVIIVMVAIFVVVVLVIVDTIIGIAVVVVIVGDLSIIKLVFVITSGLIGLFYSNRLGVCIPPGQGVIANEPNFSFRTIKVERLKAYELFVVSSFCYKSSLGPVFLLRLPVLAMVAACASSAAVTLSATNCPMAA